MTEALMKFKEHLGLAGRDCERVLAAFVREVYDEAKTLREAFDGKPDILRCTGVAFNEKVREFGL